MGENSKRNISIGHRQFISQEEVPTPPPPGFTSPFNTVREWLSNVCETSQPEKSISEYRFLLFESSGNNLLCLAGYNTYKDQGFDDIRVDFKPSNMFFPLPESQFQNLSEEQVRDRVLNELIDFTKSSKFQNSFLAKGQSITTNFAGEFWPHGVS